MSEPGGPPAGLAVLYSDTELIALDKPAGLHTAPLGREGEDTLLGRLLERFPEIAALPGRKPSEPGLLHRLDRDTSGVVLVARTAEAFHRLTAEFAAGRVRKEYLALCAPAVGSPAGCPPAGPWQAAGGPRAGQRFVLASRFAPFGPGRRRVRVVLPGGGGRKAAPGTYRTEAEVLEVFGPLVLVQAAIDRGFRHQVRAHLSHLGLPIVGDPLYGLPLSEGAGRLCLHASAVELPVPAGGRLRIRCPLPADFLSCYGGQWRGSG